jgi:murein DD-endopeptidase MepM/ murein hydrolase activator NlpD
LKTIKKNFRIWVIAIGSLLIIVPIGWLLMVRMEGEKPRMNLDLLSAYLGGSQELTFSVSDAKSGLRRIWVGLLKDGKEAVLLDSAYPSAGMFSGGKSHEATVKVPVAPLELGFTDGEATLRMVVRDYSWRDWWRGNTTYVEKKVVIDTRAPEVEVLSRAHNISQGGAGLVIFRSSEACSRCGVQVGDNFFPAHAGYFTDPRVYIAFVALGYEQKVDAAIFVEVADPAGNSTKSGLNYHILHKVFRKDRINISDGFLNRKMPELSAAIPKNDAISPVDWFLKINRDLRKENYRTITTQCRNTVNKMLWKGRFLRLPKSASRARFADHRTYIYKGREIDRQVHLGIDLASTARSPVPVANDGVVVYAKFLGIYGNSVIVDHGFGLFSMYSHLSNIAVKVGDSLSKGDILGRTGSTGLAGGDHLHFSMLVYNTFVNPVEWWDQQWINNNVLSKIERAGSIIRQE